jgi:acetyl esterase/lipase
VEKAPDTNEETSWGMNVPSLRVYLPSSEKATGSMVITLPGGGYSGLDLFHERYDWAPFFLEKGIAFGVLKYRLPQTNHTKWLKNL